MVHWNHIKDNGGLAPASRKIIKTLLKQMRVSSTFNKTVAWKNEEFKNTYRPFFKFKSSQPNEVVSDSESVLSEVASSDRPNLR